MVVGPITERTAAVGTSDLGRQVVRVPGDLGAAGAVSPGAEAAHQVAVGVVAVGPGDVGHGAHGMGVVRIVGVGATDRGVKL